MQYQVCKLRIALTVTFSFDILPNNPAAGFNGLLDPVEPGLACGSDTAHMSLLGYDPRILYRGRGAFESMGAGLSMNLGDIAFKCNFATIDENGVVISRRADRSFEEDGPVLCDALDNLTIPGYPEHCISVKYATEHRCGIVVRGPRLTDTITGTDPLKDGLRLEESRPIDSLDENALFTAQLVNALSKAICAALGNHPVNSRRRACGKTVANVVLLRGCGVRLALESFQSKFGMKAAMIAPTKIIAGLGMCLDMTIINVPGATGDYRTSLSNKACMAVDALQDCDFLFIHVKAVDDAGHDRNSLLKVGFIEAVDAMFGQILKRISLSGMGNCTLVVTGDHSTPVDFGDHSHEPVPFAIAHSADVIQVLGQENLLSISLAPIKRPLECRVPYINGVFDEQNGTTKQKCLNGDEVTTFNEISAAAGALGRFPGSQVMPLIVHFSRNNKTT